MTAKRARGPTKRTVPKKKYYNPPSAIYKIRHRLADGVPTHELLHYMHSRDKLPTDIKDIAEAAEKLHQVKTLLAAIGDSSAIAEIGNGVEESCRLLTGDELTVAIDTFVTEARKKLVLKTVRKPEDA